MKSRYQGLHFVGTLWLILAWVLLILGILAAIGVFAALGGLRSLLAEFNFTLPGALSWGAAIPALLWGIVSFLVFYSLGKALHLLVDLDNTTRSTAAKPEVQVAPVVDENLEISGELKRQATLIASTLEATQGLQKQVAQLESKVAPTVITPAPLPPPQ